MVTYLMEYGMVLQTFNDDSSIGLYISSEESLWSRSNGYFITWSVDVLMCSTSGIPVGYTSSRGQFWPHFLVSRFIPSDRTSKDFICSPLSYIFSFPTRRPGFITIEDDHNWEESITSLLSLQVVFSNGPTIASIRSAISQDWYIFPHREHRISMTLFRVKVLAMGFRENNPAGIWVRLRFDFMLPTWPWGGL